MSRFALSLVVILSSIGLQAQANDFSNVKSGLLLGIYASPGYGGMRVTSTIPGYSAEGRLQHGDVLLRATVDGLTMYRLRTTYEMENTKMAIGPNREAALEIWRPGIGMIYAWVEFTPINGPAMMSPFGGVAADVAPGPAKAQFRMESEKGGARQMFQKQSGTVQPFGSTQIVPQQSRPLRDAANLFN